VGIFPASVPLENPQWHIKIAPFVCKIAVLNNLWCHFCTERANYHQIYPKWTRQKMQNWKILWWIGSASPHPFGFTIEPFLLPPLHCNPVDIYLKKREVFKKNQMWKNYCAVGKVLMWRTRWRASTILRAHPTSSCLTKPTLAVRQSYNLLTKQYFWSIHISNRRRPESKLNWTHNDWRWHKNRGLCFLGTRIERDRSEDGQCGGSGAASIWPKAPAMFLSLLCLFSLISIHSLS